MPDQATSFSARAATTPLVLSCLQQDGGTAQAVKLWRRRCCRPPSLNISAPPRLFASPHSALVNSHAHLHLKWGRRTSETSRRWREGWERAPLTTGNLSLLAGAVTGAKSGRQPAAGEGRRRKRLKRHGSVLH